MDEKDCKEVLEDEGADGMRGDDSGEYSIERWADEGKLGEANADRPRGPPFIESDERGEFWGH